VKAIPLWGKLLGVIVLLAAACVGLAFVPTNDVAFAPIAPIDLEGKISVKGQVVEPLQGRMYLVGVTERKVNLLQRVLLDLTDPDVDFGEAPAGAKDGTPSPRDVESMVQAKAVAAGVALELAGERVDWEGTAATVDQLYEGTPAAAVLQRGDLITEVNGIEVDTSVEVTRIVEKLPPGSAVTIGLTRAGEVQRVTMKTIPPVEGDDHRKSRLGMNLSTIGLKVNLPFNVAIDSGDVVGPSAGLAFALYLYDSQTPDDLLQGRHVVATGAISPDGLVLPVGRIRQKVIAAQDANRDVFVVPLANAAEAEAAVKAACPKDAECIQIVPVRSAQEAIDLLELSDAELEARVSTAASA
jgi:PDZ domain-containing protein